MEEHQVPERHLRDLTEIAHKMVQAQVAEDGKMYKQLRDKAKIMLLFITTDNEQREELVHFVNTILEEKEVVSYTIEADK